MNWTRTILDGLAMAAYFNLFAGLVALYRPRLMFPCYPPAIIKAAKEPPTRAENRFYWLWICFGELLPLLLYGAISAFRGRRKAGLSSRERRDTPVMRSKPG